MKIDSYCGRVCCDCEFYKVHRCLGCLGSHGHPPHSCKGHTNCEVAECAEENGFRHCGECPRLPCEILHSYSYDFEYGDFGQSIHRCIQISRE